MHEPSSESPLPSRASLDVERLRLDFPALAQLINGHPLVYLDNAATVQKPQCVIDEVTRCYTSGCANVHRGAHTLGARASDAYDAARGTVQRFLNAEAAEEIVFTSGCTAAINLVASAWGDQNVGAGDEILVSGLEHHSNLLPWQRLCQRRGARLRLIPLTERGELRLDTYADWLGSRTKLVAVAHVSNALGTLNPVEVMAKLAHGVGAPILVDGAQAVSRLRVDVRALGCDFYAFSGHKLYGPFGIGALYARRELLERMPPFLTGGGMVDRVEAEEATFAGLPRLFEAGTPNLAGAMGLARAIGYLEGIGLDVVTSHERELLAYTRRALEHVAGVRLIGTAEAALGVVSFVMDDIHPHDVSTILDQAGVAVRAGHHCAQPVMRHFDVPATVRASFAVYNTRADVDALVCGLAKVRDVFG
jgi:cysteine desulfurase/selenocysteine lyase